MFFKPEPTRGSTSDTFGILENQKPDYKSVKWCKSVNWTLCAEKHTPSEKTIALCSSTRARSND